MDDLNNNENEDYENDLDKPLQIGAEENLRASRISFNSQISQELKIENLPEHSNDYNKSIKVILLGDSGSGKSSIVNCLQQDTSLQRKTISIEHYNYIIKINNFILRMQIWDTVGQEKFDSITTNYYKTTDVVIFVYAINNIESFNNIIYWDNQLNDNENENKKIEQEINDKNMIKVLVGNKKDLEKERKISYEQGEKLCKDKNFDFFEEISCNFYKNGFFDESSYYSNKEKKIETTFEDDENKNISDDNNEDNDNCVKKLFDKIGKIIYKQYMKENNERKNSSIYNYEASSTILELKDEKDKKVDKSCC